MLLKSSALCKSLPWSYAETFRTWTDRITRDIILLWTIRIFCFGCLVPRIWINRTWILDSLCIFLWIARNDASNIFLYYLYFSHEMSRAKVTSCPPWCETVWGTMWPRYEKPWEEILLLPSECLNLRELLFVRFSLTCLHFAFLSSFFFKLFFSPWKLVLLHFSHTNYIINIIYRGDMI